MPAVDLLSVKEVTDQLNRLDVRYALTGGIAVGFLLDHPTLYDVRPTEDVDAIAAVVRHSDYTRLEARLRTLGFRHDMSEGAPPCRFLWQDTKVDVMPAKDTTQRFSDRWFEYAVETSEFQTLGMVRAPVVRAPCLIATKYTAFENRGNNDWFHHDIEDIVTVVDGRESIVDEIAEEDAVIRSFLVNTFQIMTKNRNFMDALPGHLQSDAASQARLSIVTQRLHEITMLNTTDT